MNSHSISRFILLRDGNKILWPERLLRTCQLYSGHKEASIAALADATSSMPDTFSIRTLRPCSQREMLCAGNTAICLDTWNNLHSLHVSGSQVCDVLLSLRRKKWPIFTAVMRTFLCIFTRFLSSVTALATWKCNECFDAIFLIITPDLFYVTYKNTVCSRVYILLIFNYMHS